jgi:hypothetical protein
MTTDEDVAAGTGTELARLMTEFFRAVSFQPGEAPPYHLLHDLFVPGGKLIRNSGDEPEITTVEEFIAPRQQMLDNGELTEFDEAEDAEITEIFGNIAHRFSTYSKRGRTGHAAFAARGVISTQFVRTPAGWKMSSMAWDDERPGLSVPQR